MKKIGTHNSATGERGSGWLSVLVTPFARCQRKTIAEQYAAGCRYFDLRVRADRYGLYVMAHGLWKSRKTFFEVLKELNALSRPKETFVDVTYEAAELDTPVKREAFLEDVRYIVDEVAPRITLVTVNVKKPEWRCLWAMPSPPSSRQGFLPLDGRSWHTYVPIPWLWHRLYGCLTFDEDLFTFVDFL